MAIDPVKDYGQGKTVAAVIAPILLSDTDVPLKEMGR